MLDTIIFDLDGTLLDTLQDLADSVNAALAANGFPMRTVDEVRRFVGNGVRRLMELAIPEGEKNPLFEQTLAQFKEHYAAHCMDKTAPYEGILPVQMHPSADTVQISSAVRCSASGDSV